MEHLVAAGIVIFYFLSAIFAYIKPYPLLLAAYPLILLGTNSSIDTLFGKFGLSHEEEWTLVGVLDIYILIAFALTGFRALKKRPLHTAIISTLAATFTVAALILTINTKFPTGHQLAFYWNYSKVFLAFFIFNALLNRSFRLNYFQEGNNQRYEPLFWVIFLGAFIPSIFYGVFSNQDRLSLPHLNVNVLANFLGISIIPILKITNIVSFKKSKILFIYIFFGATILLTGSRTGLAVLFLAILSHEWKHLTAHRKLFLIPIFLAIILAFSANDRFSEILYFFPNGHLENIDTLRSRIAIWTVNIEYLTRENIIFGLGPGAIYLDTSYPYSLGEALGYRTVFTSAHNDFIQMTLHFGLILAITFSMFVGRYFYKGGIAPLLALIFTSAINSNFETSRFSLMIGFSMAVFCFTEKISKTSANLNTNFCLPVK